MKDNQIIKLYLGNFFLGLVFWYGIEKLFMRSIGIDAIGVGIATVLFAAFTLVFDIPAGILADKWSRKGVLALSAVSLAISSLIMGVSNGLPMYLLGYLFYSTYAVTASGTYQAIIYDVLHEKGQTHQYSKVIGRASALLLIGAAVANVFSGFFASRFGYGFDFMITVIPSALSVVLFLSVKEPKFHKDEKKEKVLVQLQSSLKTIASVKLIRGLAIVMSVFAVVEVFKAEFGQLYMLRYIMDPQYIGLLWAAYAIAWAFGNAIAHRLQNRLSVLILLSTLPLLLMSFIDNGFSLVLFMIQAVASAAMLNKIETEVQNVTPSSVRASTLSVLISIGRAVIIPFGLLIGWIIQEYNALWALRLVATLAVLVTLYWLILNYQSKRE